MRGQLSETTVCELHGSGRRYLVKTDQFGYGVVIGGGIAQTLMRFGNTQQPKSKRYGFVGLPDFVVFDGEGSEMFRYKPTRKILCTEFQIFANGGIIGGIKFRPWFGWRVELHGAQTPRWQINMRFFASRFTGSSEAGDRVVFAHVQQRDWFFLITPGGDTKLFLGTMAFMVREYLRHH